MRLGRKHARDIHKMGNAISLDRNDNEMSGITFEGSQHMCSQLVENHDVRCHRGCHGGYRKVSRVH